MCRPSGCRATAFGLSIDRVDFLRRALTVDRQLVLLPGRPPYLAAPKTQASVRTIPLPQVVVDVLAAHLAEWPAEALLFTTELRTPIRRQHSRFASGSRR